MQRSGASQEAVVKSYNEKSVKQPSRKLGTISKSSMHRNFR